MANVTRREFMQSGMAAASVAAANHLGSTLNALKGAHNRVRFAMLGVDPGSYPSPTFLFNSCNVEVASVWHPSPKSAMNVCDAFLREVGYRPRILSHELSIFDAANVDAVIVGARDKYLPVLRQAKLTRKHLLLEEVVQLRRESKDLYADLEDHNQLVQHVVLANVDENVQHAIKTIEDGRIGPVNLVHARIPKGVRDQEMLRERGIRAQHGTSFDSLVAQSCHVALQMMKPVRVQRVELLRGSDRRVAPNELRVAFLGGRTMCLSLVPPRFAMGPGVHMRTHVQLLAKGTKGFLRTQLGEYNTVERGELRSYLYHNFAQCIRGACPEGLCSPVRRSLETLQTLDEILNKIV